MRSLAFRLFIFFVTFAASVFYSSGVRAAPQADFPTGRIVVLRIPGELVRYESTGIWSGRMNFSIAIERSESGELLVAGRKDWKDAGQPLLSEMVLAKVTPKKAYTEVELRNLFVNVKLRFTSSISDPSAAFREVTFVGTLEQFASSGLARGESKSLTRDITTEVEKADARVDQVIERANDHFRKGKLSLEDNKREQARDEFDKALDEILMSGLDVRASQRLQVFYLELVEKIYREDVPLIQKVTPSNATPVVAQGAPNASAEVAKAQESKQTIGFRQQGFEPSPLDPLSKLSLTPDEQTSSKKGLNALELRSSPISSCAEPKAVAARLRGFHLGMPTAEVKARLPGVRIALPDHFGYSRALLTFKPGQPKPTFLEGVSGIVFDFLDGRLTYIGVAYDNSVKWTSLDQFVGRVSEALGVPSRWQSFSYDGRDNRVLQCGKRRFVATMLGSGSGKLAAVFIADDEATDLLEARREVELERLRLEEEQKQQQKIRQEEEKRRAFKP